MTLFERIEAEMLEARRRRDQVALGALGLLKSELVNASKEPGARPGIDDALVVRVARKELKRREEAVTAYRGAGREEAALKEEDEARVLRAYLPAEVSDAELEAGLREVIDELKPQGPGAFGSVMKAAGARFGDRAEGGRIAAAARRLLG